MRVDYFAVSTSGRSKIATGDEALTFDVADYLAKQIEIHPYYRYNLIRIDKVVTETVWTNHG